MFVDEFLHHLPLLLAHSLILILALVQVIGRDKLGIRDQHGGLVKQVTPEAYQIIVNINDKQWSNR